MPRAVLKPGMAWECAGKHLDTIDETHALGHNGCLFMTEYHGSIANTATLEIVITVGATYDAHIEWTCTAGGDADFEIYEGRTTTGGTALTPRNTNRSIAFNAAGAAVANPDIVCQETVVHTPDSSSGGTLIQFEYLAGGSGPTAGGGGSGSRHEIILKRGVKYSFILTARHGAGDKRDAMELDWYEHPPIVSQKHESTFDLRA